MVLFFVLGSFQHRASGIFGFIAGKVINKINSGATKNLLLSLQLVGGGGGRGPSPSVTPLSLTLNRPILQTAMVCKNLSGKG